MRRLEARPRQETTPGTAPRTDGRKTGRRSRLEETCEGSPESTVACAGGWAARRARRFRTAVARPSEGRGTAFETGCDRRAGRAWSQSGVGVADAPTPPALRRRFARGTAEACLPRAAPLDCGGKAFGRPRHRFRNRMWPRGWRGWSQSGVGVADAPTPRTPTALRAGNRRGLSSARSAFGLRWQGLRKAATPLSKPAAGRRGWSQSGARGRDAMRFGGGRGGIAGFDWWFRGSDSRGAGECG